MKVLRIFSKPYTEKLKRETGVAITHMIVMKYKDRAPVVQSMHSKDQSFVQA